MKVSRIYNYIDNIAPFSLQAAWDNSGLQLGSMEKTVSRVLLCLDVTKDAASYAASEKCDLTVSHHPLIFHPLKSISADSAICTLIKNDIAVISAHTNLDRAEGGVNDTLCEELSLQYEKADASIGDGFLNIATLDRDLNASAFASYLRERLGGPVSYIDSKNKLGKLAVCCGAGGGFIKEALLLGCGALLTGDADYHEFLDAEALGISLFAAGHYETEVPVLPKLKSLLCAAFPDMEFIVYPGTNKIKITV